MSNIQDVYKNTEPNYLTYTSLTPSICNETLSLPMGHPCLTDSTIKKLEKNKVKLLGKNYDKDKIVISHFENIPTDGSPNSNTVLDYLTNMNVVSEYELLKNKDVKKLLGKETVRKELERFKPSGERYTIEGLIVDEEGFDILLSWAKVFKFFYPIEPLDFTINNIKKIIDKNYVKAKESERKLVYASMINVMTAEIQDLDDKETYMGGCHAIDIFIDLRGWNSQWTVEFFDSSGDPTEYEYTLLMEQIKDYLEAIKPKDIKGVFIVAANERIIHQDTDAECGIHALIFIRRRLEGVPFSVFSVEKIPDKFAVDFRKFIYSN